MQLYNPNHIANAFLLKAKNEGVNDVDALKIQKLTYNLNGFSLAIDDCPIVGERFQAWPYGPVLATLYHQFKKYGRGPIAGWAFDEGSKDQAFRPSDRDRHFYDLLEAVWDRYRAFSGLQLSALTHAEGTPWSLARKRGDDYLNNDEIKDHFLSILESSKKKIPPIQVASAE